MNKVEPEKEEDLKWEEGEEREISLVIDMKAVRENREEEPMTDEVVEYKNPNVKVVFKKIKP